MPFPSILPPSDLLQQVEGIEQGLQKQRRVGAWAWIGVVVAAAQAAVAVLRSEFWVSISGTNWGDLILGSKENPGGGLIDKWPFLVALSLFLLSFFVISWKRYWLRESQDPFLYTYTVESFTLVGEETDERMKWLHHDLSETLNRRIKRLSLLESSSDSGQSPDVATNDREPRAAPAPRYDSHLHIGGHYGIRVQRKDNELQWMIEVMPIVRVGPEGRAGTLAHPVQFPLQSAGGEPQPVDDDQGQLPAHAPLSPDEYKRVVEWVYFSIATEIYRQIRADVEHKISLLPTRYLRATAYVNEADDYARSNTLDAYDDATELYWAAIRMYDARSGSTPASLVQRSGIRRAVHLARLVRDWLASLFRLIGPYISERFAKPIILLARARMGYAKTVIYRRQLAGMIGQRLNPVYDARLEAQEAVRLIDSLPADVAGREPRLFEATVTLALALATLGTHRKAQLALERARRLSPSLAERDARFLYVQGVIESRPRSKLLLFQRAAEIDPDLEVAQFHLALESEMAWRRKPTLEPEVAKAIFQEYERVLALNPGNLAAWANLGYMKWLLGDTDERMVRDARDDFQRAKDYKLLKRETFVAEVDYGLARIAAERGEFGSAYVSFANAITAHVGAAGGDIDSWSSLSDYYFSGIDVDILGRFRLYKEKVVAAHAAPPRDPQTSSERMRNSVLAYVTNDYGEACYNYYKRSGEQRYVALAEGAYVEATHLDPLYVIPRHNLFLLHKAEHPHGAYADVEMLTRIEPNWLATKLAEMWMHAQSARENTDAARAAEEAGSLAVKASRRLLQAQDRDRASSTLELEGEATPVKRTESNKATLQAGSERVKGAQLLKDAEAKRQEAQRKQAEAAEERERADEILKQLVPHEWAWRHRRRSAKPELALGYRRWSREWRWERAFDDVHVAALYEWGLALHASGVEEASESERIFAHVEEHFRQDYYEIILRFREQTERRLREMIEQRQLSSLQAAGPIESPFGTWGLTPPSQEQKRRIQRAVISVRRRTSARRDEERVELSFQDRLDKYNGILRDTFKSWLAGEPSAYWALSWTPEGIATTVRTESVPIAFSYSTLSLTERAQALTRVLQETDRRSPALYLAVGDLFRDLSQESARLPHLARSLRQYGLAVGGGKDEEATEALEALAQGSWSGVAANLLREIRRALANRDGGLIVQLADKLESAREATFEDEQRENARAAYVRSLNTSESSWGLAGRPLRDPDFLWELIARFQAAGTRDESLRAIRAYGDLIDRRDPQALWNLAESYRELERWRDGAETFILAMQADREAEERGESRTRHEDLYRLEAARAFWAQGDRQEALQVLDGVTGDAEGVGGQWREEFTDGLLERRLIDSRSAYCTLRRWLESEQARVNGEHLEFARRDAGIALLRLAEARRKDPALPWAVEERFPDVVELLPVVRPIVLEADEGLFPQLRQTPEVRLMIDEYIPKMRGAIEVEFGLMIPDPQIRSSRDLTGGDFIISLHEVPLARDSTTEAVGDRYEFMITPAVADLVRRHLDTYLGMQEVQGLCKQWAVGDRGEESLAALARIQDDPGSMLKFVQILQRLLREQVSVADMGSLLKAVDVASGDDLASVVERVRKAQAKSLPGSREPGQVILFPAWMEEKLAGWVRSANGGRVLAVPRSEADTLQRMTDEMTSLLEQAATTTVLVIEDELRPFAARLVERTPFAVPVLSRGERALSAGELGAATSIAATSAGPLGPQRAAP